MTRFLDLSITNASKKILRFGLSNDIPINQQVVFPSTIPKVGDCLIVDSIDEESVNNLTIFYMNWGKAYGGDGDNGGDNNNPPGDINFGETGIIEYDQQGNYKDDALITAKFLLREPFSEPEFENKVKQRLIPNIPANKITSGVLYLNVIPDLPASKIVPKKGTNDEGEEVDILLDLAVIPELPASQITSGVFDIDRIPKIPKDKIEFSEDNDEVELIGKYSQTFTYDEIFDDGNGYRYIDFQHRLNTEIVQVLLVDENKQSVFTDYSPNTDYSTRVYFDEAKFDGEWTIVIMG